MHFLQPHYLRNVLVLLVFATAAADELPLRDLSEVKDHLLVLKTGRVVRGQLLPRPGGYDVNQSVGRMFVPSEQIRFKATDLRDAHQKLRDSVPELTPDTHIDLARWCLANNLREKARQELLDALHLDGFRQDARKMLEDMERDDRRAGVSVVQSHSIQNPAMLTTPKLLPERRSLGGLPEGLAANFTQRVQVLLSNKCGNARCHGTDRNAFTLVSVRGQSTPVIAEQNLAAVLNQIDFKTPHQSPLLKATVGLHGGSRKLMFNGRTGGDQLRILRDWVHEAAAALDPNSTLQTSASSAKASEENDIKQAAFSASDEVPLSEGDKQILREAAEATRPDAFDPNIFNRRYHGRPNKSTSDTTP